VSFDGFQSDAFQTDAFQTGEAVAAAPGLSFQWGIYRQRRDAEAALRREEEAQAIAEQGLAAIDEPVTEQAVEAVAVALKQFELPDGRPYFESIAKLQAAIRAQDREQRRQDAIALQAALDDDAARAFMGWLMNQ